MKNIRIKIAIMILFALIPSALTAALPVFKVAVSEYPSWSAFLFAHDEGIIDKREGKTGPVEDKWGVDLVVEETDYDTCLAKYGTGQVDAAALTNIDSLAPSLQIPSVAILPTSTSDGADQVIVERSITSWEQLQGVKVYGLEYSVSQYLFDRFIENMGGNPDDFSFVNQDPGVAAMALQKGEKSHKAIVVWNPFCMEVKSTRGDVHALYSSSGIPGEIIDMITASKASLSKPGGKAGACAVIDAFYEVNKLIDDRATRNEALIALGSRFSNLGLQDMRTVVRETKFYNNAQAGLAVFNNPGLPEIMEKVTAFSVRRGIVDEEPKIGYGRNAKGNLVFDPQYIEAVAKRK